MQIYEEIARSDLDRVLRDYAPSLRTIVFAAVVIKDGPDFLPAAVQIWASDEVQERTEKHGPPQLPENLYMLEMATPSLNAIGIITRMINGDSVRVGDLNVLFRHFLFGRAAFLGSDDYDYLYPQELHEHVGHRPKLFIEGTFENSVWIENQYRFIEKELADSKYEFHTLASFTNHVLKFRSSTAYFRGALATALRIPMKVSAKLAGQTLEYALDLPRAFAGLSPGLRYEARSSKGDRDVLLNLPVPQKRDDRLYYSSSVPVDPADRVLQVIVTLGGRRVDSSGFLSAEETSKESGKAPPLDKNTLERNMGRVLAVLAAQSPDETGQTHLENLDLQRHTGLSPADINDAVSLLVDNGYADWIRTLGTAPFNFRQVGITPRGRFEYERSVASAPVNMVPRMQTVLPEPVGSPYGFTDQDWEYVAKARGDANKLVVVFGYAFQCAYYNTEDLKRNVAAMFDKAVRAYNSQLNAVPVALDFRTLRAGYGEHLFNEIARDVISADIAVFDTSDQNPNVMIEMGVALTWGVRVLPIKKEGCTKPPSDISGQTWADYRNSGSEFVNPDHESELVRMVERAARKKTGRH